MLGWILKRDDDHRPKTVNCSWFAGVEKRAVLAEVITCFSDPRIMDKRRCLQVMRKLLYLLNQGQTFTMREAATVLFSATKLFRFKDLHLRRLVYLIAEELCPIVEEGDIHKSALLVQDLMSINTPSTSLRAYAVRLLCRITNVPSSIKIEEYLKYAILSVDRDVSSAGLVCALHLLKKDPGMGIKVCEQVGTVAADQSCGLVKFHALCLLSRMQEIETTLGIRELARPHIDKFLSYELRKRLKHKNHPLLTCLVIRLITQPQINRTWNPDDLYSIYINRRCLAGVSGFGHLLGNEMVAIEGLYSVMKLRTIGASVVEAAIREVHRLIPCHAILRMRDDPSIYDDKPAILNVARSMLKWSRIQNHLQPDDDAAQLAKGPAPAPAPAPATDNIYLRKRRIAVSDPLLR